MTQLLGNSHPTANGIERHPVVFVGAGPGDPELITVKGRKALELADLVIYTGSLVPDALLCWTRPDARTLNSASMHLEAIIAEIEKGFRDGQRVVRLHTGDPSLYGAIFEQMRRLRQQSIPYRVVPGVTAAFAAAAAAGLEYTLPDISQTLILTRMAGRTPVPPAEDLALLAAHRASMVIYLSIGLVDRVAAGLKDAYGEAAACLIAHRVSQPEQRLVWTTVGDLAAAVKREGIDHQALIIVGSALEAMQRDDLQPSKLYDPDFSHGYRK
jgi:precorrin-4/cobalt-precorrin-4 C11-methyltransferase